MTSTADSPARHGVPQRAPIRSLEASILDDSVRVLCLDVFDTVLWRRVPRPTDVFPLLAGVLRDTGAIPEWITDATFRTMRITAERHARDRRERTDPPLREVSLPEIWREMPATLFPESERDRMVAAEVELERRLTVVDHDLARIATLARSRDIPVCLVSDTYFSDAQLRYLLDRPELEALRDARLFRSQSYGVAKGCGLWDVVLRELDVPAGHLVHVGDDAEADHRVPAEAGIRTVPYVRIDDGYRAVLDRERESLDSFGRYGPVLDAVHGDHGLTTLRGKVLATCPETGTRAAAWRYGAGVLGPVLTGFAEWAVRRASEAGARVVWCPMREGEQLSSMLTEAAQAHGLDVTARPVWLSRQSTSLASLDTADADAVAGFLRRGCGVRVRDVLAVLGFSPGEVPALAAHLDAGLDHEPVIELVVDELTATPHLRHRLAGAAASARARMIASLRRTGALDGQPLVLADLGWGGTIQLQLARALEMHGTHVRPAGFYLATDERSVRLAEAGLRAEGFLGQAGHPRELVDLLVRSPEVLEQCVSATCGSLLDYTPDGEPLLGEPAGEPGQHAERHAAQAGMAAFQRRWNAEISAGGRGDLTGSARTRLATMLGSALAAPTSEEASVFGTWQHEDNLGSHLVTALLPDDLTTAVPYLSANDLTDLGMRDVFWPALLGASDPSLAAAAHALGQGRIRAEAFESPEDASWTSIRLRGSRKWSDGGFVRVRVNPSGLSFARMRATAPDTDGIREIALDVPGRPAVVRLDWIEVVAERGDAPPVTVRWESPADLAGLAMSKCTWLGATMVEFRSAESALILPIAERAGGPVTSVRVSVAFAMLPRARTESSPPLPAASPTARLAGRLGAEMKAGGLRGVLRGAARVGVRTILGRSS